MYVLIVAVKKFIRNLNFYKQLFNCFLFILYLFFSHHYKINLSFNLKKDDIYEQKYFQENTMPVCTNHTYVSCGFK